MFEPKFIPLLAPADYQAGSQDFDSINMGKLHKVWIVVNYGAITGNDATFQLYSGATAGTKTTELGFEYRLSTVDMPAASADVLGARTAVATGGSGLVQTDATGYNARMLVVEYEASQMTDGEEWLTVATDDGSASVLFISAFAVGVPRHASETGAPTAL